MICANLSTDIPQLIPDANSDDLEKVVRVSEHWIRAKKYGGPFAQAIAYDAFHDTVTPELVLWLFKRISTIPGKLADDKGTVSR